MYTRNIALSTEGSNCTASTSYKNYSCYGAIDGRLGSGPNYEWASGTEGTGAWIQITLPRPIYVIRITPTNRYSGNGDGVKRAAVLFDNSQTRTVTNNMSLYTQYQSTAEALAEE